MGRKQDGTKQAAWGRPDVAHDDSAHDVAHDDIASVIDRRAITMVFQPIVDLASEAVVGYEALVRGPANTNLAQPVNLFAAAQAAGLTAELDHLCRAQAVMQSGASNFRRRFVLFVNGEPAHLRPDDTLAPFLSPQHPDIARYRTVLELSERSIFAQPAELLRAVEHARSLGWQIAVDDLGARSESLALVELVEPDVIKLDMSVIQSKPDRQIGLTLNAVAHQRQARPCLVVAEGIETTEHLNRARSIGADLGQGWLFGRPSELPTEAPPLAPWTLEQDDPSKATSDVPASTFGLIHDHPQLQCSTKDILAAISLDLEAQAMSQSDGAVVFAALQHRRYLSDTTLRRYARLATSCCLVAVMARGIAPEPAPGVRGVALSPDEPLADEWSVVILSNHQSVALLARDLGDDTRAEPDRRFEYLVTYDRDLVRQAAQTLLGRVLPKA